MPDASFRLRARRRLEPEAAIQLLGTARRRRSAPPCWSWSWPLTPERASQPLPPPAADSTWLADVRTVAVADDASAIAIVSNGGKVLLASADSVRGDEALMHISALAVDVSRLHAPTVSAQALCVHATSVALFHVADAQSGALDLMVAVGYDSGAVAVFDASSAAVCAITRPVAMSPVRRLRFVSAFHQLDYAMATTSESKYPYPSGNSGLFCVFGWSGTVGRLPTSFLVDAVANRRYDSRGAGWVLWRLQSQDAVVDAIPCSSEPSAVCEMDALPSEALLRVVASGINPPLAAFACGHSSAFSARDMARKAATAVFSAAKGAVYSRLSSFVPRFGSVAPDVTSSRLSPSASSGAGDQADDDDDETSAVFAYVRASLSWADEPDASSPLLKFGLQDMSGNARRSVANVFARRHARMSGAGQNEAAAANSIGSPASTGAPSAFPQNARLVQRLVIAPLPCTLFASCDTLGRLLLMDSRDLCVIRMLKGYRDAHVAWLARNGPTLTVLSPRRALVELHNPLESKRLAAFQVEPGTMLIQSTSFAVFCLSPSGFLYELAPSKKIASMSVRGNNGTQATGPVTEATPSGEKQDAPVPCVDDDLAALRMPPSSETLARFLQFCATGQTSQAVKVLDEVVLYDVRHVAHLMAMLVCTSSSVRAEVHVAVASRAARLAAEIPDPDLEIRHEAHSRLAEAFGLLAAEVLPDNAKTATRAGILLLNSDETFAAGVHAIDDHNTNGGGASRKNVADPITCERFILAHVLLPGKSVAGTMEREYILRPRDDLSEEERLLLSRAYFARLVSLGENSLVRGADPEPSSCRDVFLALGRVLVYGIDEIIAHFVDFFLWSPVGELLNTPLTLHDSGLRYALNKLRSKETQSIADDAIILACENTTQIENAMLLVRLCVVEEAPRAGVDPRFLGLLDQLVQAVQLRAHVVGSDAESSVRGRITARHFQGVVSEAERQAVSLLAEGGEYFRAAGILAGLSSRVPQLEWHEAASVSEVALQASRRRMAVLFDDDVYKEIAPSVAAWIKECRPLSAPGDSSTVAARGLARDMGELKGIQTLLIAAHEHFPDTSVDTVRCLQLAEAIAIVLRQENEAEGRAHAVLKLPRGGLD
jgi:Rab3 GTPase-activating protein regulatory subunit N-terminus